MDLLIVGRACIVVLPDSAHITNHNRLHALLMQRGDQVGCLLLLNSFDLVFEFPQLFVFRTNEPFPSSRAFLLAINLARECCFELVLILFLGTQEPPIENMRLCSVMGNCYMDLT